MGFLNKVTSLFKPAPANEPDACASGYPEWRPSATWTPEFDDNGAAPEAYDGN